ncbi:unknown protein [Seminavis robusta]|uniref:Uncharacterized protein n=1 Tax=Seminavis robusta TaxID=568900 RepID=A0A9N8F054_9STRA|nr:unknown protein [Seminavis robusta]|eukprot:Sro3370_g347320.1 n/a (192) ;mRNA; r:3160-3735
MGNQQKQEGGDHKQATRQQRSCSRQTAGTSRQTYAPHRMTTPGELTTPPVRTSPPQTTTIHPCQVTSGSAFSSPATCGSPPSYQLSGSSVASSNLAQHDTTMISQQLAEKKKKKKKQLVEALHQQEEETMERQAAFEARLSKQQQDINQSSVSTNGLVHTCWTKKQANLPHGYWRDQPYSFQCILFIGSPS